MKKLGVNIDHVATLREARKIEYPDPVYAAFLSEEAGAYGITCHLREDRRHMQDRDIRILRETIRTRMNLEMALNADILKIALDIVPEEVCIVPERREEVTTEGGLDVVKFMDKTAEFTSALQEKGILVSLFINPDYRQIDAAIECGADYIELHTGEYADAKTDAEREEKLSNLYEAAGYASNEGLGVNAGHGLNYHNTLDVALIPEIEVLNIGHSIISRAVFSGLKQAVSDMLDIIRTANDSRCCR